jgi:hypothetical protein
MLTKTAAKLRPALPWREVPIDEFVHRILPTTNFCWKAREMVPGDRQESPMGVDLKATSLPLPLSVTTSERRFDKDVNAVSARAELGE